MPTAITTTRSLGIKDLPRYGAVADSADAKGNNDGEVSISELDAYQRNLEAQLKAADEPDVKDVLERRIYSVQFARDELGAALADPVNQTTAEQERLVKIAGKVLDASFATPSSSPAERASIDQRMTVAGLGGSSLKKSIPFGRSIL